MPNNDNDNNNNYNNNKKNNNRLLGNREAIFLSVLVYPLFSCCSFSTNKAIYSIQSFIVATYTILCVENYNRGGGNDGLCAFLVKGIPSDLTSINTKRLLFCRKYRDNGPFCTGSSQTI